MKDYPFYTAYTHLNDFYNIVLDDDIFETMALSAWDKIGNKRIRLYKYITEPKEDSNKVYTVDLPCNAHIIEAVTTDYEDYQKTSNDKRAEDNSSGWKEGYVESRKYNTNHLYMSGKYIKYRQEGNKLYLAEPFRVVKILYKGIITDDAGLPGLNEAEIDAVAAFCAYTQTFKEGITTRNPQTVQLAQLLKAEWLHKCTQARVPDFINQNEMDEILNVGTSWDRKRFGRSYKPIR